MWENWPFYPHPHICVEIFVHDQVDYVKQESKLLLKCAEQSPQQDKCANIPMTYTGEEKKSWKGIIPSNRSAWGKHGDPNGIWA